LPCLIYRTVPADSSQFVPLLGCFRILEVHLTTCWESDQQTRWQCSPLTVLAPAEHRWTKQAHWGWKWHVGHRWILFFQILTAWHHQPIINHRTGMDLVTLVPTKTHPMPHQHMTIAGPNVSQNLDLAVVIKHNLGRQMKFGTEINARCIL
jgi:hypothetical protein